jgi:methylmalonyl-CoA mutase C-terminal domain/subunit
MEHPFGVNPGRVLVAKPGMDAHWRGAAIVVRILRSAGFEVVYLGHARPAELVVAALDEDVDVIGLSTLSGNHLSEASALFDELRKHGADQDIAVLVGGAVPRADAVLLTQLGVAGVFGPGSRSADIAAAVEAGVARRRAAQDRAAG